METLNVDLWTFDVGVAAASPEAYAAEMTYRLHQSWDAGANVVVFPEYAWMGLAKFAEGKDELRGVAELFWKKLWLGLRRELSRDGKAVIAGTVPFVHSVGTITNRAPIIAGGRELFQDKLCLTPWENTVRGGDALRIWKFRGVTFAVLICFDIEIPELSVLLRGRGVDCLLVPSATETILGMERVGRCASARSVELGCYVGVSHIVGRGPSEMVDDNVGRVAWFSPSQAAFASGARETCSEIAQEGFHRLRGQVSSGAILAARSAAAETSPALFRPDLAKIKLVSG
jgi:predicted amidohydrolase